MGDGLACDVSKRAGLVLTTPRPVRGEEAAFSMCKYLKGKKGVTLVELVTVMAILSVLAAVAMPMLRVSVRRGKEMELRRDLRAMRDALDSYKRLSDEGKIAREAGSAGYPNTLEELAKEVELKDTTPLPPNQLPLPKKMRFLRRVPIDPMTGKAEWGIDYYWEMEEKEVFDIHSLSDGVALDGTKYKDW